MLNKVKTYFLRVVFFLSIITIGIMLTGAIERSYAVMDITETVEVAGVTYSLDDLATEYLPRVIVPRSLDKAALEQVLYEVINNDSFYTVNYYFKWSNELHPDPVQHTLNTIWKFIYYKFNLFDIEYLQVEVNKKSGRIIKIKFEDGVLGKISDKPTLRVGGWQHKFGIGNDLTSSKYWVENTPEYFSADSYKFLKMARRSQGDFKTKDNRTNIPIIIFLALITTYYFRYIQKDYYL